MIEQLGDESAHGEACQTAHHELNKSKRVGPGRTTGDQRVSRALFSSDGDFLLFAWAAPTVLQESRPPRGVFDSSRGVIHATRCVPHGENQGIAQKKS